MSEMNNSGSSDSDTMLNTVRDSTTKVTSDIRRSVQPSVTSKAEQNSTSHGHCDREATKSSVPDIEKLNRQTFKDCNTEHLSSNAGMANGSYNFHSLLSRKAISERLSMYVVALRPWSFTTSLCPVGLGTTLYYTKYESLNVWIFLSACVCALSVHAAGNLVNTYFDYVKGVDSKKSDDRTLVDHILEPTDVVTMGAVSYCVGCVGFVVLATLSPAPMEHIALLYFGGLSASFLYTGGLGLKYIALGDLAIFLSFGPITVLFAYTSQGGALSLTPLFYAIPLALNTEAILHANNTRDMETDRESGIVTLAILLGKTGSYLLFAFLLFTPYFIFMYLVAAKSAWFVLPICTVFPAFKVERQFRKGKLNGIMYSMAKLNLGLGICYICSCYLRGVSLLA